MCFYGISAALVGVGTGTGTRYLVHRVHQTVFNKKRKDSTNLIPLILLTLTLSYPSSENLGKHPNTPILNPPSSTIPGKSPPEEIYRLS